MSRGTREQLRLERRRTRRLLLALAGVLLALLVALAALGPEATPDGSEVRETAATVAASREYDRWMELYADPDAAAEAARLEYERVLEGR